MTNALRCLSSSRSVYNVYTLLRIRVPGPRFARSVWLPRWWVDDVPEFFFVVCDASMVRVRCLCNCLLCYCYYYCCRYIVIVVILLLFCFYHHYCLCCYHRHHHHHCCYFLSFLFVFVYVYPSTIYMVIYFLNAFTSYSSVELYFLNIREERKKERRTQRNKRKE